MPKVFIAGCGFVGLATADLFAQKGWEVIGCTHSPESAAQLSGESFPVIACDISDRSAVEAQRHLGPFDAVIHCASSGRGGAEEYRRVYLAGARNLAEVFAPAPLLFTSSTSVYAQTDGGWVTEDSPATPDRETGLILRETEDVVLAHGGLVTRLAGIYGPGRSVLLRKFFEGTATIEGEGAKWINQVHRDDIASALVHLVTTDACGIFNVNDDHPLPQIEAYRWLSERFGRPLPPSGPVDTNRKRGWTDKRVSNARLRALGWTPRFPSFFDAVASDPALLQNAGL
ncbi:MAG TPA: SDR family oxidoreductase [Chthoniobacter sp.]|jgi:nucleoside-diphosphate-sugar epimerase